MIKSVMIAYLLLVFALPQGFAQTIEFSSKPKQSSRKLDRKIAEEQIKNLKNGVLLIRLSTKSKTLKIIRDKGFDQKANEMENEQMALNRGIATAFAANIKFCKTAFFYSNETDQLLDKNFDDIHFMNGELKEIPNPLSNGEYYLILDLAILKERDPRYDSYRQEVTEKGIENKPVYYTSTNLNLPAFVVLDQKLDQLTDPFPYYVRAFSLEPEMDRVLIAAQKLNKRLFKFYEKSN